LISSRYYSPELCRFISPDDIEYLDSESVNGLNLYCYCLNNPISYYDPSGHMIVPNPIYKSNVGKLIGLYIRKGFITAYDRCTSFGITGWKRIGYSLLGMLYGDLPVSLANIPLLFSPIKMETDTRFKFQDNPNYSFWNAGLYAYFLKNTYYKEEDSRTILGLYIELQAHYLFYLAGNSHAMDGADMGPTSEDDTAMLSEWIASKIMGAVNDFIDIFKTPLPKITIFK